ncbi:MAG: hypothetical protein R3C59_01750 [Planctomycetaceae bacterium]
MNQHKRPDSPEDLLPQEVVAELRQRHGPQIPVPDALDAAVLGDAARHLSGISRPTTTTRSGRRWTWVAASMGTLAAAVLLFAVYPRFPDEVPPGRSVVFQETADALQTGNIVATTDDVDGNGQVNILDAFALARTIQAGRPMQSGWDRNGDGLTNQSDVDLIAMNAVML